MNPLNSLAAVSVAVFFAAVPKARAATPVHEFEASSASNVLSGTNLVQWVDIGPGHNYSGGLFNIDLTRASAIQLTSGFSSPGTNLTGSFQSAGGNASGA